MSLDVTTIQAPTIDACRRKFEETFGIKEYKIISQKTVYKGGFLGLFAREECEVTFAYKPAKPPLPADFEEERRKILSQQGVRTDPAMQQALADVKAAVKALDEKIELKVAPSAGENHESLRKLEELLILNDFSPAFIAGIMDRARREFSLEDLDDYSFVRKKVLRWIGESISIYKVDYVSRPKIIALVGPTGVGKTTTIAKFAAAFSGLKKNAPRRKVQIITIDNYRIGAKHQIDIYAGIIGLPVSLASTRKDLEETVLNYAETADYILIDTIGSGIREFKRLGEMRDTLSGCGKNCDVYLTMSASAKSSDMREIMQQFEPFNYRSIVITKLDETVHVGNVISLLAEKQKQASFLTMGQNVPCDIEPAAQARLLARLDGFNASQAEIEEMFPVADDINFQWG